MCAITGLPIASAASRERRSASRQSSRLGPTMPALRRTLIPTMTSACARATSIARSTRAQRRSSSSPTTWSGSPRSRAMPICEMFSSATRRVALTSMTYRRNAGKVDAPAEPASTAVVTPRRRKCGSGSIPKGGTPQNPCVCRSTRPGVTISPVASTTCRTPSTSSSDPTAVTRWPSIATSRKASSPWVWSMTRPPRMSRSCIGSSLAGRPALQAYVRAPAPAAASVRAVRERTPAPRP